MRRNLAILCLILAFAVYLISRGHGVPTPNTVKTLPLPNTGPHVLVIEETEDRRDLTAAQLEILTSTPLREWLDNRGIESRFWDQNANVELESEWFRKAMNLERDSLPWMVVADGNKGVSKPLSPTVEDFKREVEKNAK